MSASDLPVPARAARAFWPTPDAMRVRARELFAPGTVLPIALDGARGLAALAVLAFHLRSWLMVPYAEAAPHGPVLVLFYLATSFGHEAVIVFFVLSGFLIGGAGLRLEFGTPGAVADYAIARLARIAPVLGGAVLLAVVLQALAPPSGPACRDTLGTVAGNLLALGNLGVPVLCNDLPLWSLSNEVAYYIAFPTLVALARGRRAPGVVAACAATLAICAASLMLTPWDAQSVALYFPAWLAGASLWWLPRRARPIWPGLALLAVALAASRMPGADRFSFLRDGATALGCAALLAGLLGRRWAIRGRLARVLTAAASGLAGISFSLYVTHHPVIDAVLRRAAPNGAAVPMTHVSWPLMIGLGGACLGTALTFAQVFERPHRAVAGWLRRIARGGAAPARF